MKLLDRIFGHPSLCDHPPVLVDVGASGGVPKIWRRLARYSVGIGFEPDGRERDALVPELSAFRQWIFCDKLVVANDGIENLPIYLTKSPYCSSTLKPDKAALAEWSFSELFDVQETRLVSATTLAALLRVNNLMGIDWLKCDTQGLDLRIWQSLSPELRERILAVEFEPGLIDAYIGEGKFHHILEAMEREPFWLGKLEVESVVRGPVDLLRRRLGSWGARQFTRFGTKSPGWVNALFLNRAGDNGHLDLRGHLLLWVFATELEIHSFACAVAETAARRFNDRLCTELASVSARHMRGVILRSWPHFPRLLCGKFFKRSD